ncbi:nuclear transport factor 2 family protein [Pseudazoarcus pumilus]|uniref:nuclear transport factor 2 family protein n=1 Tax=Pseudazoarcus pumilus TaxID=2067960 RepID=UPI000F4D7B3C|nr:nuclear transport factor 2 family protein [Pseudazoarcus pumilus]
MGLALSGCANFGLGVPDEQAVQRLAEQRWAAVIAGDAERAYGFLAPSYRAVVGIERYRSRFASAAKRENAEVVATACEAERCRVTVRVEYTAPAFRMKTKSDTHVFETWVREEGRWWLHQRL